MKGKINNNEKWFEVYVLKLFSNFSNNVKLQLIRVNSFINISKRYISSSKSFLNLFYSIMNENILWWFVYSNYYKILGCTR